MRSPYRVLVILSALAACCASAPATAAAAQFTEAPKVDLAENRMFGIGVADADRDGRYDIFTTNHKFRSSYLTNRGGGRFTESADQMGMIPDERWPGIELLRAPADMSAPGIYIWPTDKTGENGQLHIRSVGVTAEGMVRTLGRNMNVRTQINADAVISRDSDDRPQTDFVIRPGGQLVIDASSISDLPIQWKFDPTTYPINPSQIRVGAYALRPSELAFDFTLRDRHGMAFADVRGDSAQDVFVTMGGLGGGIADPRFLGRVEDQFLISGSASSGAYSNQIKQMGFYKGRCRGRQSEFSDWNSDGRLDILSSCEGDYMISHTQVSAGMFQPSQPPRVITETFRFAQLDRGPQELLASTGRGLEVWRYSSGRWSRSQTVSGGEHAAQISLADYDNTGTLDALVTAKGGLALYSNHRGRLRRESVGGAGLPTRKVAAASFVDYDNDGFQDVSVAPMGIYRYDPLIRRYTETRLMTTPAKYRYAILQWVDFDNDGRRDPIAAMADREFSSDRQVLRKRNVVRGGRSIAMDLRGVAGNREAIGARVDIYYREKIRERVRSKRGKGKKFRSKMVRRAQTAWVGQADDSRFSQGHYRVYFGLGRARVIKRVVISWPDGSRSSLRGKRSGQLIRVIQR